MLFWRLVDPTKFIFLSWICHLRLLVIGGGSVWVERWGVWLREWVWGGTRWGSGTPMLGNADGRPWSKCWKNCSSWAFHMPKGAEIQGRYTLRSNLSYYTAKKIISNTLTIDKPIHQCLYNKRFLTQCTLKSFILQLTLRNLLLPWLYMSISRVMHCISVKSLRLLSLSLVRSSTWNFKLESHQYLFSTECCMSWGSVWMNEP